MNNYTLLVYQIPSCEVIGMQEKMHNSCQKAEKCAKHMPYEYDTTRHYKQLFILRT